MMKWTKYAYSVKPLPYAIIFNSPSVNSLGPSSGPVVHISHRLTKQIFTLNITTLCPSSSQQTHHGSRH